MQDEEGVQCKARVAEFIIYSYTPSVSFQFRV